MTFPEEKLPAGWTLTTIEEIVGHDGVFSDGDWVESKDQDPTGDVRLIQLADVGDGVYRDRSDRYLTKAKAIELSCTFLKPGDVLIARMPDPLGRACIFPGDSKTSVTVVDVCIVRTGTQGADHRWLMHAVNSPTFRQGVASLQSGSTRKRISRRNLAKLEFPLPPLPEQHRIVAEIEKQLTRLDAGVTALRRAQAKLRRYKAAVLKAACEGRLVPQDPADEPASALLQRILAERRQRWEAEQIARGKDPKTLKYKEPAPPDTSELPGLPEGWVWASLEQLSWDSGYGTSQKCDYDASGPPVLRIPNVSGGRLDFSDMKYAIKADELTTEKAVAEGDILIIRTNGSRDLIGRSALVRQSFEKPYFFASYLIRFRIVDTSNIGVWLATAWDSQAVRRQIERMAATTAGQYNINITKLNRLELPIPPSAEQQRIITEVERRLSVVEELEAAVEANLKRAERLRQAVLKRAFEGRLVPQEPNDEPASALLARVRAERVGREAEGRGNRKSSRQQKRGRGKVSDKQLRLL